MRKMSQGLSHAYLRAIAKVHYEHIDYFTDMYLVLLRVHVSHRQMNQIICFSLSLCFPPLPGD